MKPVSRAAACEMNTGANADDFIYGESWAVRAGAVVPSLALREGPVPDPLQAGIMAPGSWKLDFLLKEYLKLLKYFGSSESV